MSPHGHMRHRGAEGARSPGDRMAAYGREMPPRAVGGVSDSPQARRNRRNGRNDRYERRNRRPRRLTLSISSSIPTVAPCVLHRTDVTHEAIRARPVDVYASGGACGGLSAVSHHSHPPASLSANLSYTSFYHVHNQPSSPPRNNGVKASEAMFAEIDGAVAA